MIARFIIDDYSKISTRFNGTHIINPKPSSDLEIGKDYLVFSVDSCVQNGEFPGMTYYYVKADYYGSFPISYPAELFEIIENRIPSSYRIFQNKGPPTYFGIYPPLMHPDNNEFFERLWDGDPIALDELYKLEQDIITELGYEKYFADRE